MQRSICAALDGASAQRATHATEHACDLQEHAREISNVYEYVGVRRGAHHGQTIATTRMRW
eukprot:1604718-Lingulodinium_polyedra.AAC.1